MASLELISPNNVTANAMMRTVDMIRSQVHSRRPALVAFCVGTQINGAPHLGTSLVQAAAFLLAAAARKAFSVEAVVRFGALDNAPYDIQADPDTRHAYQITYHHALGAGGVANLIDKNYRDFFNALAGATGVDYEIETYTAQQQTPAFRAEFLRTLRHLDAIRWALAPSHGVVHLRLPCPSCGWAEKRAERTKLVRLDDASATLTAVCTDHGEYEVTITPESGPYIDLATLYRNLVKERVLATEPATLPVMVKGGDWAPGCQLVDTAFAALHGIHPPARIFTPMVLTDTGAKLSKSLIRDRKVPPPPGAQPWMLDATAWPGSIESYADAMVRLTQLMLSTPRHFYRSYTTPEINRLMSAYPASAAAGPRARNMNLYRRYFDLVASGRKTIEVRVEYTNLRDLAAGEHIRFSCDDDTCLVKVERVARYASFEEMLDTEGPTNVNPDSPRDEQLANIRRIYGPEKEALGVLAIQIARVE
ncbi:ASCH domain-containing protein [Streptosporangium sp. G12]